MRKSKHGPYLFKLSINKPLTFNTPVPRIIRHLSPLPTRRHQGGMFSVHNCSLCSPTLKNGLPYIKKLLKRRRCEDTSAVCSATYFVTFDLTAVL